MPTDSTFSFFHPDKQKTEPPSSRQPGYLRETRDLPSPPLGGFGFVYDSILRALSYKSQLESLV
jgi:hypothetical protein